MFYIVTACTLFIAMVCGFYVSLFVSKRIDRNNVNDPTELDRL